MILVTQVDVVSGATGNALVAPDDISNVSIDRARPDFPTKIQFKSSAMFMWVKETPEEVLERIKQNASGQQSGS